jgi:hypothetical protein
MSQYGQIRTIVYRAIRYLYSWLSQHVHGFQVDAEELYACALYITAELLGELPSNQRYQLSEQQHCLKAQPESGLTMEQFIHRAVIGPAGLLANSISKGMLFPYLEHHGLRKAMVEFKKCLVCQTMYEGEVCANPDCHEIFHPQTTEVIGREWLVIEGAYLPVRRWGCKYRAADNVVRVHYYRQEQCKDIVASVLADFSYRVVHGDKHDACPWQGCPNCGSRHAQRGTTLWARADLVSPAENVISLPLNFFECLTESILRVMEEISDSEKALLNQLGENEAAIAETLIAEGEDAARFRRTFTGLSRKGIDMLLQDIRPQVIEALRRILEERGFDEETVINYLRLGQYPAETI